MYKRQAAGSVRAKMIFDKFGWPFAESFPLTASALAPPPIPSTGPQGTIGALVFHWGLCQSSLVGNPQMPCCRCRPRPVTHRQYPPPNRRDCPRPHCSRPCRSCHDAAATAADLCVLCSTLCPLHYSLPSQTRRPAASPGSNVFTVPAWASQQLY